MCLFASAARALKSVLQEVLLTDGCVSHLRSKRDALLCPVLSETQCLASLSYASRQAAAQTGTRIKSRSMRSPLSTFSAHVSHVAFPALAGSRSARSPCWGIWRRWPLPCLFQAPSSSARRHSHCSQPQPLPAATPASHHSPHLSPTHWPPAVASAEGNVLGRLAEAGFLRPRFLGLLTLNCCAVGGRSPRCDFLPRLAARTCPARGRGLLQRSHAAAAAAQAYVANLANFLVTKATSALTLQAQAPSTSTEHHCPASESPPIDARCECLR